MIFEKSNRRVAETFLKTIHKRLQNAFTPESLGRVKGEEKDTRVGEINTFTDENSIENDRALLAAFGNPQEEANDRFNKPVEKERRRTFIKTFDARDFPKMKAWGSGKTVKKVLVKEAVIPRATETTPQKEKQQQIPTISELTSQEDSNLDRFLKRMDNLEKSLEEETKKNKKNLNAIFEGTERIYEKMKRESQKSVENMTSKIEEFTLNILERDRQREDAQVLREQARDRAQDRTMAEHLSQTLKLLETLAKKVSENEKIIQEGKVLITSSMSMSSGMYAPNYSLPQQAGSQVAQQSPPKSPRYDPNDTGRTAP